MTSYPATTITIQGDININLLRMTPQQPFFHCLIENNLHSTIITPTRHDPHHKTSSLIDTILTTQTQTDVTAGTISPPLSDHLPIYTIFHNPIPRKKSNRPKTLSNHRYEKHKQKILSEIQTAITKTQTTATPSTTTSMHFHNIQQAIKQVTEAHERRANTQIRKPWCNPKLSRQIRKQHRLHKRSIESPTTNNIAAHRKCRNKLNANIKAAKRRHLADQLRATEGDAKKRAKILKSIIPSRKQPRTSPTAITYENQQYTDPVDIANALNDRFITIGHKTSQTIPIPEEERIMPEPSEDNHPPFQLQHTTIEQVIKTMKKIKRNKASDIYKIKPAIMQDLRPFLAPILTNHFNQAIDEHEYPDALKCTKVIEVYKKADKTDPANYRPISLLPIIAKLFDTILNQQMMSHLTTNNIISPTQYAFRPNSSTTVALQAISNKIHKHKSDRQPLLAIYIDLSKAYDTISHKRLLHKLRHNFNFTATTTAFFASYFRNRTQSTHTQHAQSKTQTITHGIPQGSTLSTTFFLLYINDIIKTTPNSKVYTYADDTTLIITANSLQDLQQLAQSELTNLINYFYINNLVPNPIKTNYTIFYPNNSEQFKLSISTTTLKQNEKAKLLGITIQKNMKHHQTITTIIKKLQPTIHSFKYATKLLPTNIMKQLYYQHIFPHLIGNITIWGTTNSKATYMQPLIRTHKKIIRLLKNQRPRTHTKPIMTELQILSLTNLYIHRVCVEMHPFIHPPKEELNRPEHNHHYMKTSQVHSHRTRYSLHNHQFIPQQKNYSKKKPKFTTTHLTAKYASIWNKLPAELRDTESRTTFKKDARRYLLERQNNGMDFAT
jgi:hypothetical protein